MMLVIDDMPARLIAVTFNDMHCCGAAIGNATAVWYSRYTRRPSECLIQTLMPEVELAGAYLRCDGV